MTKWVTSRAADVQIALKVTSPNRQTGEEQIACQAFGPLSMDFGQDYTVRNVNAGGRAMEIRKLISQDREAWGELYISYADFYRVEQTEQMRTKVWDWLMSDDIGLTGFVAEQDGVLIGLAHLRPFLRPLAAQEGLFLDDLFVDPSIRAQGAGRALISAAKTMAEENGMQLVRWITADDNYRARALYDTVAERTGWITYDATV